MKAEETINRIRGALADHLSGYEQKSENRVYIEIPPEVVIEAAQLMFEEVGARLQIATGLDTGQGIEVMYHWALDEEDCVVTVRVTVPYETPQLESITGICPAAEWIEREMWELLGLEFHGHPDMRHLLLDDDWPEGNYPLRREEVNELVGGGHARDSLDLKKTVAGMAPSHKVTNPVPQSEASHKVTGAQRGREGGDS